MNCSFAKIPNGSSRWPLYQCQVCRRAVEIRDGRSIEEVLKKFPPCGEAPVVLVVSPAEQAERKAFCRNACLDYGPATDAWPEQCLWGCPAGTAPNRAKKPPLEPMWTSGQCPARRWALPKTTENQ